LQCDAADKPVCRPDYDGYPALPPRPPLRLTEPETCVPLSARIRSGTPCRASICRSASLGPGFQPCAVGLGCVWNLPTTTHPAITGGWVRSILACPPLTARRTVICPVPVSL